MSLKARNEQPDICRICLTVVSTGEILSGDGPLLGLFEFCMNITISSDDLTRKLCKKCSQKVNDFANFKKLALRSDKLWRSSIKVLENYSNNDQSDIKKEVKKETITIPSEDDGGPEYTESDNIADEDCHNGTVEDHCPDKTAGENSNDDIAASIAAMDFSDLEKTYAELAELEKKYLENQKLRQTSYSCEKCERSFRFKRLLNKHLKLKCERKKYYCGLCDTTLLDVPQLQQHVTQHGENNDLYCKLCDFSGRDFADMAMHRYRHLPAKGYVKIIMCHVASCKMKFNVSTKLQYHYRSVHLKKNGGVCTVCSKEFKSYNSWRNHERFHRSENYTCDICGLKFLFKNEIISHLALHSDYNPVICEICGRGFKRNTNLKSHIQTTHDNEKVTCKHCNKEFKNQQSLRIHLRQVAAGKPYQCEVCSKAYAVRGDLKSHMVWHRNDRPFVCNVCGSSYKVNSQLTIHMRTHTGIRPYKCDFCNRCFTSSNQLKVHVAVHTGNRKYKCELCPRSFHGKKLLVQHCVKRHNGLREAPEKSGDSAGSDSIPNASTELISAVIT